MPWLLGPGCKCSFCGATLLAMRGRSHLERLYRWDQRSASWTLQIIRCATAFHSARC